MDSSISSLLARIEVMEAERGILATLSRYAHSIDYGLEAEWVDCFTEHGIFDVRRRVASGSMVIKGRAALAEFIAKHTRPPQAYHKHLALHPVIHVDGAVGRVESYFARVNATPDGSPYIKSFGRYLDRLEKSGDGRWRFSQRIAEVEAQSQAPRHAPPVIGPGK